MTPVFLVLRVFLPIGALVAAAGLPCHAAAERLYELRGRVVSPEGRSFRGVVPRVVLRGAVNPFASQTQADPAGNFRFRRLRAGMYTLYISVPTWGELRQTVQIGPTFADSRGRIERTFTLETTGFHEDRHVVSARQLAIPDRAVREYERAIGLLEKPDIAGAVERLKKAVEIAPHFASAWNHLGTIAYQSRDYARAEGHFRRALKEEPGFYSALVNLGGALLSQGKREEALSVNLRAVRARPADALAHSQLGQSYFFLDRLEEAEKHLKRAKELDPAHFSLPQLVLAEIYRRRNQREAMARELEEFLALHPDSELAPQVRKTLDEVGARASGAHD